MQPRQTPKWLELFITAFGANGLVALAWWLGALQAERIRSMHSSYPFLEITGEAGAGKTSLQEVLWRLVGADQGLCISPDHATPAGLLHNLARVTNQPIVLEDTPRHTRGELERFDWDSLKPLFNGGTGRRQSPPAEPLKFRGALVISANMPKSEALRSRIVSIHLRRGHHTAASAEALKELETLSTTELSMFVRTAAAQREQIAERLRTTTNAMAEALQDDTHGELNHCTTLNHAQLRALLVSLDDLFVLPPAASRDAHAAVHGMAWSDAPKVTAAPTYI